MKRETRVYILGVLMVSAGVSARQQPSQTASASERRPTHDSAPGPVIAIDEAHRNAMTFSGPYPALIELLKADGYRPRSLTERMSAASLADVGVLVIFNPGGLAALDAARARVGKPPSTGADEEATGAQAASLSDDEVSAVIEWLKGGGSLLLNVGHAPYPLAAAKLTTALGIQNWPNGSAGVRTHLCKQAAADPGCSTPDGAGNRVALTTLFWRADFFPGGEPSLVAIEGPRRSRGYQSADAVLAQHRITEGRGPSERVRRVVTFGGSAFQAPPGGVPLLTLPRDTMLGRRMSPPTPVPGWLQGAVMEFGEGRLAIFADQGLFSGGPAADNRQFVLNVMHWLSGKDLGSRS